MGILKQDHLKETFVQSAESGTQYRLFQAAVILKGINGVLEIIGGILLMAVGSHRINRWIEMLTQGQLEDSPHSFLLKILTHNGITRQIGPVHFAVAYLLINGVIKVVIVSALMKRKVKVFPYAIAFLGLFVIFGIGRLFTHHSVILGIAMALDVVVIALIWREYKALKKEDHAHSRRGGHDTEPVAATPV